ncbi:MAG: hypothetical protein EB127_17090 [Alphaproteobacteria bacterium]|nr:hypothetical protein [Alphaproteobacteria bacterium]
MHNIAIFIFLIFSIEKLYVIVHSVIRICPCAFGVTSQAICSYYINKAKDKRQKINNLKLDIEDLNARN